MIETFGRDKEDGFDGIKTKSFCDIIFKPIIPIKNFKHDDPETYVFTEGEEWPITNKGIIDAIFDTLVAGARLGILGEKDSDKRWIFITKVINPVERPRDIVQSLRDLADSIEKVGRIVWERDGDDEKEDDDRKNKGE